jgi:excisionase family DNA binding protein
MTQETRNRAGGVGHEAAKENERPLTKVELAEYYNVDKRTIETWMAKRYIPYVKIGKTIRFYLTDVDDSVKKGFGIGYRRRTDRPPA